MLGFLSTALFCEFVVRQPWSRTSRIVYTEGGDRANDVAATHAVVPWWKQTRNSLWHVCGPSNLVGVVVLRFLGPWAMPHAQQTPHVLAFMAQFLLLALFADLFLYWGHRIQHENQWLWSRCHSFHHRLRTPTSMSTAFIDDRDALLQSVIPLLLSPLIVQPHPITYSLYVAFHLSNNAWNHSGLDSWLIDLMSLKFLPLRCRNTLHDAHHRFSGFQTGKNYGEMFWLWDWVFGTLTKTESIARHQS